MKIRLLDRQRYAQHRAWAVEQGALGRPVTVTALASYCEHLDTHEAAGLRRAYRTVRRAVGAVEPDAARAAMIARASVLTAYQTGVAAALTSAIARTDAIVADAERVLAGRPDAYVTPGGAR